ncbi:hypothetical protein ACFC1I_17295 [Microbacterium sp. NPDC056044]|uniref:hypothetical protein n=1 Tax=Microbacterium sp. NPDC056044 TaxID=3345690 RepID=UPI0035D55F30
MKKHILLGAAALVLVAVPAVIGLWGNSSFAQSVPVRVPSSGQVVTPTPALPTPSPSATVDDHGGDVPRDQRTEPGDDRDLNGTGSTDAPSAPPATTVPPVDDHGGDVPRDQRTEPGDDRRSGGSDDSGGHGSDDSGSDDSGSDDSGSGHGGHGGDD